MAERNIFNYTKDERFAVVKKLEKGKRHKADFSFLHPTQEAAEAEALRLAKANRHATFYVVEIKKITGKGPAAPKVKKS